MGALKKRKVERKLKEFDEHGFAATYGNTNSVANWANKHRKIEKAGGVTTIYEIQREEDKKRKKEHTNEELAHMRVDHDAEKINAGSTVIMTFKDSRILG